MWGIGREREDHMFVVKLGLKDEDEQFIQYDKLDDCLLDAGLRALFEDELVSHCFVLCDGQRITSIPVMTWDRFKDHVISNAATILRRY